MKKILLQLLLGFSSLLAQDCASFAKNININDKSYITKYGRDLNDCYKKKLIKSINELPLKSFERAESIFKLSKENLDNTEKVLLQNFINENICFYMQQSKCSAINEQYRNLPLVYLGVEKTQKGILVVEYRLKNNNKLSKKFFYIDKIYCENKSSKSKYIALIKNEIPNYMPYTREQRNIYDFPSNNRVEVKEIKNMPKREKVKRKKALNNNSYIVVKKLQATNFKNNQKILIKSGEIIYYLYSNKEEIFCKYKGEKYRIIKEYWHKKTKRR